MSEQKTTKRRRGNPAWQKGGPSPNPKGRPRAGLALAERIRETVDPDEMIRIALTIARGQPLRIYEGDKKPEDAAEQIATIATAIPSPRDQLAAIKWLGDSGFVKPPQQLEVNASDESTIDYSKLSSDELATVGRLLARASGEELEDDEG